MNAADTFARVSVRILDKEYQVSCPLDERAALIDSADLLNRKMREIRDSGKVVALDRIAVMAALNLAHEVIGARSKGETIDSDAGMRLRHMRERVEAALDRRQQLEL